MSPERGDTERCCDLWGVSGPHRVGTRGDGDREREVTSEGGGKLGTRRWHLGTGEKGRGAAAGGDAEYVGHS